VEFEAELHDQQFKGKVIIGYLHEVTSPQLNGLLSITETETDKQRSKTMTRKQ
jgi:hypothetical protein